MATAEMVLVPQEDKVKLVVELEIKDAKNLDNILELLLNMPYLYEQDSEYKPELSADETIFVMKLTQRIGKSGIRKYIKNT